MTLIGLLINILIILLVLAIIYKIAVLIAGALGVGDWNNIILAIILLIGLLWFLGVVGMIPGAGPIVRMSGLSLNFG